ncbi:MAG: efflux RND transporter periplasmic adaptor subunit [Bacteroidetes bacterium]|nr:efflux RND transporter periplasmic adaptor subunit [Bacteroidota bacterium]
MIQNIKVFLLAVIAITIASCGNKKIPQEAKQAESKVHSTISLSEAQKKAIGLEVGELQNRNLKTTLKANGKLMLPPQNQASVSLSIGGIVKSILVTEGAFVAQGQVLATIQNTEFIQLQQDYLHSRSQLSYLRSEYDRQKELQKENINAVKIFQKAEADYNSEVTNYNALRQKLTLYNVNAEKLTAESISNTFAVTAPIAGNIHNISINIGSFAEPNKQLFDIIDNRYLHIDLTIFERDISKIHEGQKISFTDANHSDHVHSATIFSINKAFEQGQQAVIAHAKILDVNETLLPGMFIEARISVNDSSSQSIPESAIVSNGNEHYVFVEVNSNQYKRIRVRLGATDLGFTEIFPFEEISVNQKVVVKGAYNLLSELTKDSGEDD